MSRTAKKLTCHLDDHGDDFILRWSDGKRRTFKTTGEKYALAVALDQMRPDDEIWEASMMLEPQIGKLPDDWLPLIEWLRP